MFSKQLRIARYHKVFATVLKSKRGCPYLKVHGTGLNVSFVPARKPWEGYVHAYLNVWNPNANMTRQNQYLGMFELSKVNTLIRSYGHTKPRKMAYALESARITPQYRRMLTSGECVFREEVSNA